MKPPNNDKEFDDNINEKLEHYVYGLFDPKDNLPFYIGKAGGKSGKGNARILHHFHEAKQKLCLIDNSEKIERIQKIWARGQEVDWKILRSGLKTEEEAFAVEAALIDTIKACGIKLCNKHSGHHSRQRGLLLREDIYAWAAPAFDQRTISAELRGRPIFIFNIHNAVRKMRETLGYPNYLEATVRSWIVGEEYRKYEDAIAIGLVNGVSRSAFFISEWKQSEVTQEGKKWEIVPEELPEVLAAELLNKNYSDLLEVCKGYIQRGGFPIIQFPEGGGEIIFLRGRGKDKRQ